MDSRCPLAMSKITRILITHMHGQFPFNGHYLALHMLTFAANLPPLHSGHSELSLPSPELTLSTSRTTADHINGLPGLLATISAGDGIPQASTSNGPQPAEPVRTGHSPALDFPDSTSPLT